MLKICRVFREPSGFSSPLAHTNRAFDPCPYTQEPPGRAACPLAMIKANWESEGGNVAAGEGHGLHDLRRRLDQKLLQRFFALVVTPDSSSSSDPDLG